MSEEVDAKFWEEWGKPLGLELVGWTYQNSATFRDPSSMQMIHVSKHQGRGGDSNFAFLDRIRIQLEGKDGPGMHSMEKLSDQEIRRRMDEILAEQLARPSLRPRTKLEDEAEE